MIDRLIEQIAQLPPDPACLLPPGASAYERTAGRRAQEREDWLAKVPRITLQALLARRWDITGRAAQKAPDGAWQTWLILAGRGFGKTRAGAEWVLQQVRDHRGLRIALIANTLPEARAVMVEGASGILAFAHGTERPAYESSNHRLIWKDQDCIATLYSAAEPESLRGPQHHFAWCDEIAKWRHGDEVWLNLLMGLRLGLAPRTVVTTTPRAVPLVRQLVAEEGAGVRVTRGRTADNRAHLAGVFVSELHRRYAGTAIGRQELDGELIEEIEGALWTRALIDRGRRQAPPALVRTVIGVDPPAGVGGDACGIVVVGLGADHAAYVLADASVKNRSPESWARAVASAAAAWRADRIVAEVNNGGAMVESVLRAADARLPIRSVHAAVGKVARAEPVAALYEAGRAFHVGAFAELEDELCGLIVGGGYEGPGRSPDRADALVWAMHELMLGKHAARPRVRLL